MAVVANYIGLKNSGDYWVNVRNAEPKGLIGDGGVIRRFASEKEAKEYTNQVNTTGVDTFQLKKDEPQQPLNIRHEGDVFVSSAKAN
jgi:hypothetical protein